MFSVVTVGYFSNLYTRAVAGGRAAVISAECCLTGCLSISSPLNQWEVCASALCSQTANHLEAWKSGLSSATDWTFETAQEPFENNWTSLEWFLHWNVLHWIPAQYLLELLQCQDGGVFGRNEVPRWDQITVGVTFLESPLSWHIYYLM